MKKSEGYLKIIWNLGNYVKLYSNTQNRLESNDIASKWIRSRRDSTKQLVTDYLEDLKPHKAIEAIKQYLLEDLSRTYVHFIRENVEDKKIQATLSNAFLGGLKLLAPFTPFITEKIYQEVYDKKGSIFLTEWPLADKRRIKKDLEDNVNHARNTIQAILSERNEKQIGVRWPLLEVNIVTKNDDILKAVNNLKELIKLQVNCKNLVVKKQPIDEEFKVTLNTTLTPELEKEGYTREVLRRIQDLRKKSKLNKKDKIQLYLESKQELDLELIKKTTNAKIAKKFNAKNSENFKVKEKEFEIGFNKI